ncbi:hypothetical protein [Gordonia sp. SL306]|uniref:hypothetical protein n=1 Tax=Gordonia sp. SL306 TaxID=2995145 RepID=UPI0022715906|nr:hypothetical protein [Gordonia sp. SL306]WAC57320.1 hypothetical protein OVA31_08830 [Gordonia sp. SL306]
MKKLIQVLLSAAVLLAACGTGGVDEASAPSSSESSDPLAGYTFPHGFGSMTTVWQAAPGLDLADTQGTLVRAYFESQFIAEWSRASAAFPGFVDFQAASGHNIAEITPERDHLWGGTRRLLLRSVSVLGDEFRASICDDRGGLYLKDRVSAGGASSASSDKPGESQRTYMQPAASWYVVVRRNGEPSKWPAKVDIGPARAPNWDVFHGWGLVERGFDAPWKSDTDCGRWAQSNYPGAVAPDKPLQRMYPNGFPDPAFQPTLEQSPGWTRIGQP